MDHGGRSEKSCLVLLLVFCDVGHTLVAGDMLVS